MSRTLFSITAWMASAASLLVAFALSTSEARAQQDLSAAGAICADLTQPPLDVANSCRLIADDSDTPIEARIAAAFRAGGAYQRMDEFAEAEAAYSVALELDPGFAEAYAGRAVVREKLDDIAAAEEDHNAAIALRPGDAVMVYNRGVFYFRADRDVDARTDFYEVLDLDPTAAWAYVYLGAMDDLAGDDVLAISAYEQAFLLDSAILNQFQRSMESQGFDPGLPGEYSPETRAGLLDCMAVDCIIGQDD